MKDPSQPSDKLASYPKRYCCPSKVPSALPFHYAGRYNCKHKGKAQQDQSYVLHYTLLIAANKQQKPNRIISIRLMRHVM
jgi:hypothetical protein